MKEKSPINKLLNSIDNLFVSEKEQNLRIKLAKEIKNSIFTNEIITKLYENDFTGLVDEESEIPSLFSTIFPICINNGCASFRLYKHKIELNLSDKPEDRYFYIFSDGRLTSGLFQCFRLYDEVYVDKIKHIIEIIPIFKKAIEKNIDEFEKNIELYNKKVSISKKRELLAEENFKTLTSLLK